MENNRMGKIWNSEIRLYKNKYIWIKINEQNSRCFFFFQPREYAKEKLWQWMKLLTFNEHESNFLYYFISNQIMHSNADINYTIVLLMTTVRMFIACFRCVFPLFLDFPVWNKRWRHLSYIIYMESYINLNFIIAMKFLLCVNENFGGLTRWGGRNLFSRVRKEFDHQFVSSGCPSRIAYKSVEKSYATNFSHSSTLKRLLQTFTTISNLVPCATHVYSD